MRDERRFILANGDSLREPTDLRVGGGPKRHPYTYEEARDFLLGRLDHVVAEFDRLPPLACPAGEATALLTLHPTYMAMSYFPGALLDGDRLRSVGSRLVRVVPRKVAKEGAPQKTAAIDLFVAGTRRTFRRLREQLRTDDVPKSLRDDLRKVEQLEPQTAQDRITGAEAEEYGLWEAVLHTGGTREPVVKRFLSFLADMGRARPASEKHIQVTDLAFVPVRASEREVRQLAQFGLLRAIRPLPKLRPLPPVSLRAARSTKRQALPDAEPVAPRVRAAVFDAGIPGDSPLSRWVDLVEPDTIGEAGEHLTAHGQAVTSALLFGSVDPQGEAPQPYGYVDHIRVVDSASLRPENIDLYDVLGRVQEVLNAGEYEFVNLSIGPELPVDDRDVHAWTAVLDEYLASGAAMAAVAAGNNGAADAESGDTRVLVPSDSVNAVAVGASDKQTSGWARAPYSAVGPGRRPGRVKPDVVCFGGSDGQPFYTVGQDGRPRTTMGTSFASPLLLRTAMGIRVAVGPEVPAVAVKAMLINGAQRDERPIHEVGWGRVDAGLSAFVECAAHEVSILYYGHLRPAEMVRLPIPWPEESPGGYVTLTASMCIACPTCPADAANYTRAGVSPVFVPHSKRWNRNGTRRATKPFFTPAQMYPTEWELRRDAHKWETVMKNQRRFQGRTLNDPYFKFHYMAREGGRRMGRRADTVPYALVVCLRATAMPDLYDRVFARYRTRLAPIRPRIELPVRIT